MTAAELAPIDGVAGVRLRWAREGEAVITAIKMDALSLRSQVALPPGARVEGVLVAPAGQRVKMKIHGSRRDEVGLFVIEARAVDWTRTMRESVAAQLGEK